MQQKRKRFGMPSLKSPVFAEPSSSPNPRIDQAPLRKPLSITEDRRERLPSKPIKGSRLPVFGNSAGAAADAGGGVATAIKIGSSAGGAGGGGGMEPVSRRSCSTTVTGSSTIFVAET